MSRLASLGSSRLLHGLILPQSAAKGAAPWPARFITSSSRPSGLTAGLLTTSPSLAPPTRLSSLSEKRLHHRLFSTLPNPLQRRQRPLRSHPEAEPLTEADLVNPSGRIYSVDPRALDPEVAEQLWVRQFDFIERPPPILGPILFSLLVGGAAYAYLASESVDRTQEVVDDIRRTSWDLSSWIGSASLGLGGGGGEKLGGLSERKIREAVTLRDAERAGMRLEAIQAWTEGWGEVSTFLQRSYTGIVEWYLNLSPHKSATLPLIAVNTLVFLLWKVPAPAVQAFMRTHFLHRPSSGRSYTLLTSTFSHQSFAHFGMNNLALYSIGASGLLTRGFLADPEAEGSSKLHHTPESSSAQHFGALFVVAGLASALGSHLFTAFAWRRAFARSGGGLGPELTKLNRRSSLGSSGAIYSALVMSAMGLPDARVSIIFLPFFSFPISYGVGSMVALDTLGAIRGWALFDHVAHLSGAAFGAAYFLGGNEAWEALKRFRRETREKRSGEDRPNLSLLRGERV